MGPSFYAWTIAGLCAAGFVLTVMPVVIFLFTGWKVRRDKLLCYMNETALALYYTQFPWTSSKQTDLRLRFREQFNYLYGRRHYGAPMLLLIVISGGSMWAIARSLQAWYKVSVFGYAVPAIAMSAVLGAFMWSISDQLDRILRCDLAPVDVYGWCFRMLLAIPFGTALAAFANKDFGIALAFLLGAFPTTTLFTFARRIAVQKLSLGDQQAPAALELEQLQSISRSNAEHFQDEGVDTISTLAWSDPVDLALRTNFDFNYVLDCMSQALLWVYFEKRTRLLFPLSLRGAQEVAVFVKDLEGVTLPPDATQALSGAQRAALATLQNAVQVLATADVLNGKVLEITEASLLTTLRQVADDPYTQFISLVWH